MSQLLLVWYLRLRGAVDQRVARLLRRHRTSVRSTALALVMTQITINDNTVNVLQRYEHVLDIISRGILIPCNRDVRCFPTYLYYITMLPADWTILHHMTLFALQFLWAMDSPPTT